MKNLLLLLSCIIGTTLVGTIAGCASSSNVAGGAEDVNTIVMVGMVRDSGGNAIPNATVKMIPSNHTEGNIVLPDSFSIVTDDNGSYSIVVPENETYSLLIWNEDSLSSFLEFSIEMDSANRSRVNTLGPLSSLKLTLPDPYLDHGEIVIRGTDIAIDISNIETTVQNGIITGVISEIPEAVYSAIEFQIDDEFTDLLNGESISVESGTVSNGAVVEVWDSLPTPQALKDGDPTTATISENGTIWVGTATAGLFRRSPDGSWSQYPRTTDAVSIDSVTSIFVAGDSVVIGAKKDVLLFSDDEFTNLSIYDLTINGLFVNDVAILNDGSVTAAFSAGLGIFKNGSWSSTASVGGIPLGSVFTVCGTSSDSLFAIDAFGAFQYNKTTEKWELFHTFSEATVANSSLLMNDTIVIASQSGVIFLKNGIATDEPTSKDWPVISLYKGNSALWAVGNGNNLFGIRSHSSMYDLSNSPLDPFTDYVAVMAINDMTIAVTTSGTIHTLQYKRVL